MKLRLLLAAVATAPGAMADDPAVAPPPQAVQPHVQVRRTVGEFAGVVIAVDRESITVRGFGTQFTDCTFSKSDKTGAVVVSTGNPMLVRLAEAEIPCAKAVATREVLTLTLANGETVVVHRADQKPRRFPAGQDLRAGGFDSRATPRFSYRLADVRIGDEVVASCELVGGVDSCRRIKIHRRPGGRVPPAPGQKPDDPNPYHEQANAEQEFEEFGTPLPDKYDPDAVIAKAIAVAEHNRRAALRLLAAPSAPDRVAPMPREAKPKP